MLEVLTRPGARDPEYVLAAVVQAVTGVKAADREKQRARTIGTAIHAGIEWLLRTRLGEDAGPEPLLPDSAAWAIESWKDWAVQVCLEPLAIERTVFCARCGYAGTLDLYARVGGSSRRGLEEWQGHLTRSLPPNYRLPARRDPGGAAGCARADRAAAETPGRSGLGGHARP